MSLTSMVEAARNGGTVEVEQGWTQGRAIFGGLSAALLLAAMKGEVAEALVAAGKPAAVPPLRSITVSFIGPATPGPVELRAEVLRVGSNVTQAQATLHQSGQIVATALAAFGNHRESKLSVTPSHVMPELPDHTSIEAFPYIEKLTPEFYQFVELRQVGGQLPFSGAESANISGWTALREDPASFDEEYLVLLTDSWPPAPIQMLDGFAPGSSLTWTLELITEINAETTAADAVFAYQAETDSARDGYAHTHAMMWRPDGELVAISRQSITIFA